MQPDEAEKRTYKLRHLRDRILVATELTNLRRSWLSSSGCFRWKPLAMRGASSKVDYRRPANAANLRAREKLACAKVDGISPG